MRRETPSSCHRRRSEERSPQSLTSH